MAGGLVAKFNYLPPPPPPILMPPNPSTPPDQLRMFTQSPGLQRGGHRQLQSRGAEERQLPLNNATKGSSAWKGRSANDAQANRKEAWLASTHGRPPFPSPPPSTEALPHSSHLKTECFCSN
ncbi:hypothetical protein AAFF_G00203880 [Aldrovandia affinis]|uniref:Uncharacterized protein n=1 Tax=Aldrovandia affinis TaxID=143900 RepID=A0AAD7SYB7_9TELE|nr:hypothetical protein AAFF_G00203880 [Aldrovandia affinis]